MSRTLLSSPSQDGCVQIPRSQKSARSEAWLRRLRSCKSLVGFDAVNSGENSRSKTGGIRAGAPGWPMKRTDETRGFLQALAGDGRPLLIFVGLCLVLSGVFALFLALTGQFLPHDLKHLGMNAEELCARHGCR